MRNTLSGSGGALVMRVAAVMMPGSSGDQRALVRAPASDCCGRVGEGRCVNAWAMSAVIIVQVWENVGYAVVIYLAGLQAIPKELHEAAEVDGASGWRRFWEITFPLMLPVSITAILIRIIFKLKLADIIINITAGGPGGATDSVTSFILREYRDRSNVGYGTLLAIVYLVLIVIAMTILMKLADRWMRPRY